MKPKSTLHDEATPQLHLPFDQATGEEGESYEDPTAAIGEDEDTVPALSSEQFRRLLREDELVRRLGELGATATFLKQFENWILSNRTSGTAGNYLSDIRYFFSGLPAWAEVMAFLTLEAPVLRRRMEEYRNLLIRFHLKPATVKHRLTALRALLRFAEELRLAAPNSSEQVPIERASQERKVQPLSASDLLTLLQAPDTSTLGGLRDTCILRLLSCTALQRDEVCVLNQGDFDAQARVVRVPYRPRSDQRVQVPLLDEEVKAISKYLHQGQGEGVLEMGAEKPLFQNLDGRLRPVGERLTGNSIYYIVCRYRRVISSPIHQATLSPRDLRDGAIETALQRVGGTVDAVARQFPHIRPSILSTYWRP